MPLIAIVAIVIVGAGLLGAVAVPAIVGGGEDPQPPEPAPAAYQAPADPGHADPTNGADAPTSTVNDLPGWGEPARELPVEERPYGRVLDPSEYGPGAGSSYPDNWDHERDLPRLSGGAQTGGQQQGWGDEAPIVGSGMDAYDQGLDRRELDASAQQQPVVDGMEGALRQFESEVRRDSLPAVPAEPEQSAPVEVLPTTQDRFSGDTQRRVNLPLGE